MFGEIGWNWRYQFAGSDDGDVRVVGQMTVRSQEEPALHMKSEARNPNSETISKFKIQMIKTGNAGLAVFV